MPFHLPEKNIRIRVCLHPSILYPIISHRAVRSDRAREKSRDRRGWIARIWGENKQLKTNSQQAKYETSSIWADIKYGPNKQIEERLTYSYLHLLLCTYSYALTPCYLWYVLISSLKSEFLEPSRMKKTLVAVRGPRMTSLGSLNSSSSSRINMLIIINIYTECR